MSVTQGLGARIAIAARKVLNLPTSEQRIAHLVYAENCRYGLDVGCGGYSVLTPLRPGLVTVGVDGHAEAIEASKRNKAHDHYVVADVLKTDIAEVKRLAGCDHFDIVVLMGVIEHVPKRVGFELLERCEALSSKFVVVETPNGFVPQGPEFGNPLQRHVSGWFKHDFEGLGYDVYGTTGTKYLRGYAAQKRWDLPGVITADFVLAQLLMADRIPKHAFNLIAIKDVRGVPARLDANGRVRA